MTTTPTASPELPDLGRLQFRKKPVVIEAIQWPGCRFLDTPPQWFIDAMHKTPSESGFLMRIGDDIFIETLEGRMRAEPGDWIIRGIKGEIYPCKPEIFEASYERADRVQPEGEAPQADAPVMVPKFEGQFDSHQDWVNRAQRVLSVPSHKPSAICVDAKGRRCHIGADMKRASEEGAFPVRYFWECELATPAATLSPLCGAQHAESGKEVRPHKIAELLRIYDEKNGDWCAIARAVESRYVNADSAPGTPEAPKRLTEEEVRELALQHLHDDTESAGRNGFFTFSAEGLDGFAIDLMERAAQLDGGQEGSESNA